MKIRNGFVSNSSSSSFTFTDPFCVKVLHRTSSPEGVKRIDWCKENDMDFTTLVIRGIAIGEQIFTEDEINKSHGVVIVNGQAQKVELSQIMEIGSIFVFDLQTDAIAFSDFFKSFTNEPYGISIYKPNEYRSTKKQGRTWHSALLSTMTPGTDTKRLNDIIQWCEDNIKGYYVITKKNIYFESNDDALHFKMVWW